MDVAERGASSFDARSQRVPCLRRKTEHARCPKRNTNYICEFGAVFMPADRCAGGILGNQRVLKAIFGEAGKLRRPLT
jgi:hypothetical protein